MYVCSFIYVWNICVETRREVLRFPKNSGVSTLARQVLLTVVINSAYVPDFLSSFFSSSSFASLTDTYTYTHANMHTRTYTHTHTHIHAWHEHGDFTYEWVMAHMNESWYIFNHTSCLKFLNTISYNFSFRFLLLRTGSWTYIHVHIYIYSSEDVLGVYIYI